MLWKKKFNKALPLFRKLLSKKILRNYVADYALVKDNYGYALFENNPNEGESLLLESKMLREQDSLIFDLPSSYMHLSNYYIKKDKFKALQYADKAYKAANLSGNPDEKLEALAAKILIDNKRNNADLLQEYITLNKYLLKTRSTAKNEFAKLRYDRKDIVLENTLNETRSLIFAIISLVVIAISIFIWYKIKKDRQLDEQRTTARFAKKIHDEVANDMFQAMAFAEHEDLSDQHIREILLDNLEDIYSKTRDISKDNGDIDTGKGFPGELRGLINAFVGTRTKIVMAGLEHVEWDKASAATKFTAYRIVQEWLVNMKKHSNASLVVLNFRKTGRLLEVQYTDDGIGSEKKYGNGLQNAENRTKQLKGTLNFETAPGKGFRAMLQIPF